MVRGNLGLVLGHFVSIYRLPPIAFPPGVARRAKDWWQPRLNRPGTLEAPTREIGAMTRQSKYPEEPPERAVWDGVRAPSQYASR